MVEIAEYAGRIRRRIEKLLAVKKAKLTPQRCCLRLTAQKISIIHINKQKDKTQILLAKSFSYKSDDLLPDLLADIANQYNLLTIPCYLLLELDEYQLFMIEALPVANNEILSALNFRLRKMINYPIEGAAIDYFMLPAKKSNPEHPMIAAVVAKKSDLSRKIDIIKADKMQLSVIGIPELALKNLAAIYEVDEITTSILYFQKKTVIINISHQKKLYFTRRLNFNQDNYSGEEFDHFCLEINRYFDYFRAQWRLSSPSRIFVIAEDRNSEDILQALSEHLLVKVEPYTLTEMFVSQNNAVLKEEDFLTLGCVLHEDDTNVTPAN